jgi:hypothetical protein
MHSSASTGEGRACTWYMLRGQGRRRRRRQRRRAAPRPTHAFAATTIKRCKCTFACVSTRIGTVESTGTAGASDSRVRALAAPPGALLQTVTLRDHGSPWGGGARSRSARSLLAAWSPLSRLTPWGATRATPRPRWLTQSQVTFWQRNLKGHWHSPSSFQLIKTATTAQPII